jgi:anhydro-N-acetylmuramic acid kinase
MLYSVIGLMSGSSLDGLDIVFTHLHFNGGKWDYEIKQKACYPYSEEWTTKLRSAQTLSAAEYLSLHIDYGHYLGQQVNRFVIENNLQFQVQLISSHGHTVFHFPGKRMTAQLGDGAAIAVETGINTVSDLRAIDMALDGQGAPIVPIGEKLLLGAHPFYLNIGGIANISAHISHSKDDSAAGGKFIAFDICPANRVLNLLSAEKGRAFDKDGELAQKGKLNGSLLKKLNELDYYSRPFPKSLDNSFGLDQVYPIIKSWDDGIENKLCTYTEHVSIQIRNSLSAILKEYPETGNQILVCGGGGHNKFLMARLKDHLATIGIELIIPENMLMDFKEALIMAFIGVLRWREETNVLASVTGARRDSIGGAIWMGQEA